jgi:Ca-activated chloride channel family protein
MSLALLKEDSQAGSESQMILLVTDGESINGNPEEPAKEAASEGIRVFTVGIGTTDGEIIPLRDDKGKLEDYKKDSKGNIVKTKLDEKTLQNIATVTGGSYLRAVNGEVDIQAIIDELGAMHKTDIHERKISRLRERYQLPLGVALFFLMVWFTLGERRRKV